MPIKASFRPAKGKLPIANARVNNLQNVSVDIPAGVLTVVTGVAGSGKSSLIHESFLPPAPRRDRDRPVAGGRLQPLQPGHVHRHHGRCPQGLCQGQQGQPVPVQLQLQGRLRKLPGPGRHLHRAGLPGRGQNALRDLRRQALQGRGAGLQVRRQVDRRRAGHDRPGGARLLRHQGGGERCQCASCRP